MPKKKITLLEQAKQAPPRNARPSWFSMLTNKKLKTELLELRRAYHAGELGDVSHNYLRKLLSARGVVLTRSTFRDWLVKG